MRQTEFPTLARFLATDERVPPDSISRLLMGTGPFLVLVLGLWLKFHEVPLAQPGVELSSRPVAIHLQEIPTPDPIETQEVVEAPVLTPETILSAPVERPAAEPEPSEQAVAVAPQESEPIQAEVAPRRVYGVRKVYARGLGPGGNPGPGLVTKLGNSLDGSGDNLIATAADLDGQLASLSSVDKAPEPLRRVKPIYSPAMLKAKAKGVVVAYLLVDVDGRVKDIKITRDIGLDSRQVAIRALQDFQFKPALKQGNPVAVWILHRIRFEYQE